MQHEPIRVLHMIASLNIGGSQAMVMNLYRNIDREMVQFDFIIDHPEETALHQEIESLGGRVYVFPTFKGTNIIEIRKVGCQFIDNPLLDRHGTNPIKEVKLISFYKKVIRDVKPDIVFTFTIKPNAYGGMACASLGVPYVANVTGLGTAIENGGLMQKVSLMLYKMGLKKAQKVFFQNTENRDFMLNKGVVKQAYDLLPGSGVNLKQYKVFPYGWRYC